VITGPIWDMWPTVQAAVKQVHGDAYTASDFGAFSFMAKGGSYLAPFHNFDAKLPADVKQMVADKQKAILEGSFRVNVDENTPPSD
jgi:basic membrane lipoprotein Med (substrate-binding protein (PBP1-ABC) superfamily)